MELPELEQGLQEIQQTDMSPDAVTTVEAPWLNMDSLMQGYGNWFGNDQGLGEMLLGQLRAHGVDTQAATEAMLRELLQGLVDDLNTLQQRLTGFTANINQQMQQTQAVADSVQAAINSQNPDPLATQILPPTGADMPIMNDIPPEMGAGDTAPVDMPPVENVPPQPAPEPQESAPTPEAPAEEPASAPQPEGTVSDVTEKSIVKPVAKKKFTLSDAAMKTIRGKLSARKQPKAPSKPAGTAMNMNILAGCQGGF